MTKSKKVSKVMNKLFHSVERAGVSKIGVPGSTWFCIITASASGCSCEMMMAPCTSTILPVE